MLITFDIFKPTWSIMCLFHLRSEDIVSPRKLNSDTINANSALFNSLCKNNAIPKNFSFKPKF